MAVSFVQKRFMATALQKWAYKLSGFNKYGLMRDDLVVENNPDVIEALKRLHSHVREARNFRILRAMQLSVQKEILPKEQWTKMENDKLYLTPFILEVIKERQEREEWCKKY